MTARLLLDEMLSGASAAGLVARGHDVAAVATDPKRVGLPDEDILARAAELERAVVTGQQR